MGTDVLGKGSIDVDDKHMKNQKLKLKIVNRLLGKKDEIDYIIEECGFTQEDSYNFIFEQLDTYFDNDMVMEEAQEIRRTQPKKAENEDWLWQKASDNIFNEQENYAKQVFNRLQKN